MGYIKHHYIIVTCFKLDDAILAHKEAERIFDMRRVVFPFFETRGTSMLTEIIKSPVDSHYSFTVMPDGSKEGWPESNNGDELRAEFVRFLKHTKDFYGSWVEISLDENGILEVISKVK